MQNLGVALLDGRDELVLNVHVLPQLGIGGSLEKPVQDDLHVSIIGIQAIIYVEYLAVVLILISLIKDA